MVGVIRFIKVVKERSVLSTQVNGRCSLTHFREDPVFDKNARFMEKESWLSGLDSNQNKRLQRALCYRYTTGQTARNLAPFLRPANTKLRALNRRHGHPIRRPKMLLKPFGQVSGL